MGTRVRTLSILWLLPFLLPHVLPAGESPDAGPEAHDEWHLVYLAEKPAGYLRITSRPREEGGHVTTVRQKLTLRRGAVPVETEMTVTTEEDEAGRFVGFESRQKLSRTEMRSSGHVEDGFLVLEDTTSGGEPVEARIPADPEAVGPQFAEEKMKRELKEAGDSSEVVLFLPEIRRFVTQKAVMGKVESVEVQGSRQKLRSISITQDALPGTVITEWVDDRFRLQKSSMKIFGMELVTLRSTPEAVLAQDFSSPPEIFLSCSIPVDRAVPLGATQATYRLTALGEKFPVADDAHLFRGPGQSLLRSEGPGIRVLRIQRTRPETDLERPVEVTPELAPALRSNATIQSDDAKIRTVAREIVGDEKNAWKASILLERWVYRNIRRKNMSTAFAAAREVLQTREGDCTEHAVLLAALLRAARVPSRVVAGLLYHKGAFVGHMWTEVHMGEWVPLDATLGRGEVGASHIALSASSLDSASASSFFLDLIPIFGNLKIEVLEVKE